MKLLCALYATFLVLLISSYLFGGQSISQTSKYTIDTVQDMRLGTTDRSLADVNVRIDNILIRLDRMNDKLDDQNSYINKGIGVSIGLGVGLTILQFVVIFSKAKNG